MASNESEPNNLGHTAEKFAASEYLDESFGDPRAVSALAEHAHRQTLEGHLETSHYRNQSVSMEPGQAYDVS